MERRVAEDQAYAVRVLGQQLLYVGLERPTGLACRVEELDEAAEGNLAAVTYLTRRTAVLATASGENRAKIVAMLGEKDALERDIADLKSRKKNLNEDRYYAELETLFVRLARLNDRIEGEQGTGQ